MMTGYCYFEPIIKKQSHLDELAKAIAAADQKAELNLTSKKDSNLPNLLKMVTGTAYPIGIDNWCKAVHWNIIVARQLVNGIYPIHTNYDRHFPDELRFFYYTELLSKTQVFPSFFRLDGFSNIIVNDIKIILKLFGSDKNISNEINKTVDDFHTNLYDSLASKFMHFEDRYCSQSTQNLSHDIPENYFRKLRILDSPEWLEPVIRKNQKNLRKIKAINQTYGYSSKTEKQLLILIGWLTARELIGKNLRSHSYTQNRVLTELATNAPENIFNFATETAKKRAGDKLFRVAKEQEYCYFSSKN